MTDIKKILGLDLISIKPYFTMKNLLILLLVSIAYVYFLKNPSSTFIVAMTFALLFASYPFLIGENAGIDGLYRLFGIRPREVVLGRYLSAVILFFLSFILGSILYIIISLIRNMGIDLDILWYMISYLIVFLVVISFQYPIFFRYGYQQARVFAMVPMFLLGFVGVIGGMLGETLFTKVEGLLEFILDHQALAIFIGGLIVLAIVIFSISLSIKFYKKRDL